jgi:integrase
MSEAMEKGAIVIRQKSPLLPDFAVEFFNWVDNSSLDGNTKRYYNNGWRLLQTTNVTGMRLKEITTDAADALKFPASVFNANNAFRILRRMLNKAKEWNKLKDVPSIKLRKEYRRERMIEPEEEVKILAFAGQPLRDVIIAILDGGMRPGEVFAMRWEHVNWNRGTYFNPKGKSTKARRIVFLSDRFRSVLLARWQKQLEGWIFPSKRSRSGHIVSVEKQFLDARRAANISKEVVL